MRSSSEVGGRLGTADDKACNRREAQEGRARLRGILPVVCPRGTAEHGHRRI
jgi:hypothetical protein